MSRYYFPSGNKYGNKKVDYDGHTFDSIKEYDRYVELKILKKAEWWLRMSKVSKPKNTELKRNLCYGDSVWRLWRFNT